MRRLALLLIVAVAIAVAIPAASTGHHVKAKTYTIKVGDNYFSPKSKTIHLRDIVKWQWVGADKKPGSTLNEHTIVEAKDRFKSKTKLKGTYSYRFKATGTFTIYCAEHIEDMKLTVKVKK